MNYYELNIPRICTALADWMACCLYLRTLQPRLTGLRKYMLYAAALAALSGYLVVTDGFNGWQFNALYAISILLMWLFLAAASRSNWRQQLYYCARSVLLAGVAASLTWQLYVYFAPRIVPLQHIVGVSLFVIVLYAAIYVITWLLENRDSMGKGMQVEITTQTARNAALIAFGVYVLSSISYARFDTPFTANGTTEIYLVRSIAYMGGVAMLVAYHAQVVELQSQHEADSLRTALLLQYENYKMRQESIELINRKYHDLKHQIAILRAQSENERNEILDQMEEEIRSYEAQTNTGNKVLDTVLTGKGLTCSAQHIQLTSVVDGSAVDFMHVMDISNLFGNALDNAIESTAQISDPERRLIHLSVSRQKGFVAIRVENCYEGELQFENGLPLTTKKKDPGFHGYGVKSIQATAAKYGGTAKVTTRDGWFELRVLIPIQN